MINLGNPRPDCNFIVLGITKLFRSTIQRTTLITSRPLGAPLAKGEWVVVGSRSNL